MIYNGLRDVLLSHRERAGREASAKTAKKVSQEKMAARGGMKPGAWGRLERGETLDASKHLEGLLKALGMTEVELFDATVLAARGHYCKVARKKKLRPPGIDSSPLMLWVDGLFRLDQKRLDPADRERFEEQRLAVVDTARALYRQYDLARKFYEERAGDDDAT